VAGQYNRQLLFPFFVVTGLVNPAVTGIVGSGVVVHVPSFFDEFDTLHEKGNSRLFFFSHTRLSFG
jgi:adenylosuccinate synthase